MELAIAATDQFRESVDAALAAVEALHAAIDSLPDEKVINIRVETTGNVPEDVGAAAGAENVAPDTAGFREAEDAANDLDEAFARLDEILKEQGGDWEEIDLGAGKAAETVRDAGAAAEDTASDWQRYWEGVDSGAGKAAESLDEVGRSYRQMVDEGILPADSALRDATSSFAAVDDAAVSDAEHLRAVGDAAGEATVPFTALGLAARDATEPFAAVDDSLREAGADAEETAGGFDLLGAAARGIVNGFANVETTWKNTNVVWGLSLNALHWIVMGSMELLAVAVPAMVAFGAAGLVAMQGAQETANRLESIYTVTESLGGAFNVTAGNVLGLKSVLQQAQNAADPLVWEALGAAINGVKVMGGGFVQMGTQVLQIFDRWAAAVDVELAGAFGKNLTGILSKGAQDATAFGQALGNIGHFIVNLASDMPGLAEVLLGAVAGFTKLLAVLTNPGWHGIGSDFVTLAMGIEEAWRWGGMLSNVLGTVVTKFGGWASAAGNALSETTLFGQDMKATGEAAVTMGEGMESAGAVLSGPWGWVIIGAIAGLTLLAIKLNSTKSAAQQFVAQLEATINNANITQGFTNVGNSLNKLGDQYSKASTAAAAAGQKVNVANDGFGRASSVMNTAAGSAAVYAGGMSMVAKQGVEIIDAGEKISSKFGISLPAAFEAADMAGLKVGSMFQKNGEISATALQQIQNYIDGYKAMSGNAGALSNNIDAVDVQLGLQNTKVGQLNQAWDQFMANATGGTSSWASLQDDVQQLGNVANTAGSKISAFSGSTQKSMQQTAVALKSFGGQSAQVWQNYDAGLTQANTVTDWWRTAAASGAVSGTQLTQAVAHTAAQLLPFAQYSKTATSELSALVQQAGGPATSNFSTLAAWVNKNNISTNQYNGLLGVTTAQLANVNQQAQQFSQTLQGDVSQAIITGSGALATVTKDTQNFSTALKNNVPQSDAVKNATSALTTQLVRDGYNAQSTGSMIYQLGIQQGLTKNQAYWLEQQAIKTAGALIKAGGAATQTGGNMNTAAGDFHNAANQAANLVQQINGIHSKTVTVGVDYVAYGAIPGGASNNIQAGLISGTSGYTGATGMLVPGGYGGGDVVPAMLEPGEAVVPKHLTPAVAPFLKAHGVPGFEGGGIVGSDGGHGSFGGGGDRAIHVHVEMNGTQVASALIPSLTGANGRYAVRNSGKATGVWKPV